MGEFKSKIRDIESERKGDIEREKRVNKDTTVKQSFYGPVHSTMLSFYCPTKASFYGAFSPHTLTHTKKVVSMQKRMAISWYEGEKGLV